MKENEIQLPLAQYRLKAIAKEDIQLPAYTGSAWRGLFGHALRSAVCVTGKPECKGCLLYQNCVYSYVFETPPPAGTQVMRKYTAAPHPFVLIPDANQSTEVKQGDELLLDFTLFGKANQHLPYILYALEKAGERGLGTKQGQFSVTSLWQQQDDWQCIYEAGGSLQALPQQLPVIPECPQGEVVLRLETLLRLRLKEREVGPKNLDFYSLFSVLMRRLSMLRQFHTDTQLALDFKELSDQARAMTILRSELHWHDWSRYSSRQKTSVKMGGLMGSITLDGASLKAFWSILYLGQFIHAGKGTGMGLGRFTLHAENVVPKVTL